MIRRVRRAGSRTADTGVSLIELILAVALLGTSTVTILGAFATLIKTSDLTRRTGDAGSTLAAVAEAVSDNTRNPYDATCAAVPPAVPPYDPTPADMTLPPTIAVSIDSVKYWNGATFDSVCHDDVPAWRLQLIEIRVTTADGKVNRAISVVKRG